MQGSLEAPGSLAAPGSLEVAGSAPGLAQATPNVPIGLRAWISANVAAFQPPVGNKVVFAESEFIFMVVRGPNARNDFHINPGDEIFYQIDGTIAVDIRLDGGAIERRQVGPGDVLLVPARTPHSPHRPEGSWGVVIERQRSSYERDRLVWYCPACGSVLHEITFVLADIEIELARAIAGVNDDIARRTCRDCGTTLPAAEPFMDGS